MKEYSQGVLVTPITEELANFCRFLEDLFKAGNTESPIEEWPSRKTFLLKYLPGDGIDKENWKELLVKYSELSLKKY
jgi:hypothetical protein